MENITRTYQDLDLNFEAHPITGDVTKKKGDRAVIASIKNLILTNHYERPFNPAIGSNVRRMLFEPMDSQTTVLIREEIINTITNYEPRATLEEVIVSPNYDGNRYDITITFSILNRPEPVTVSLFLERIR
jgi:phage baseplate assembly protein W